MAITVLRWIIRIAGIFALGMGLAFWGGTEYTLLSAHQGLGYLASIALLLLAVLAFRQGVAPGLLAAGGGLECRRPGYRGHAAPVAPRRSALDHPGLSSAAGRGRHRPVRNHRGPRPERPGRRLRKRIMNPHQIEVRAGFGRWLCGGPSCRPQCLQGLYTSWDVGSVDQRIQVTSGGHRRSQCSASGPSSPTIGSSHQAHAAIQLPQR